jgi:hypothetical protein
MLLELGCCAAVMRIGVRSNIESLRNQRAARKTEFGNYVVPRSHRHDEPRQLHAHAMSRSTLRRHNIGAALHINSRLAICVASSEIGTEYSAPRLSNTV